MKPITIFFEIDFTSRGLTIWQSLRGGTFCGDFKGGKFRRVYWCCFAVAFVRMDLRDYNRHIASGATEWRSR